MIMQSRKKKRPHTTTTTANSNPPKEKRYDFPNRNQKRYQSQQTYIKHKKKNHIYKLEK
jgi:hypothetical protein